MMANVRFQVHYGTPPGKHRTEAATASRNLFTGASADTSTIVGEICSERFDPEKPPKFSDLDELFPKGGWLGTAIDDSDMFTLGTVKIPRENALGTRQVWFRLILEVAGKHIVDESILLHNWLLPGMGRKRTSTVANRYVLAGELQMMTRTRIWGMNLFYNLTLIPIGTNDDILNPRGHQDGVRYRNVKGLQCLPPTGMPAVPMKLAVSAVLPVLEAIQYQQFLARCYSAFHGIPAEDETAEASAAEAGAAEASAGEAADGEGEAADGEEAGAAAP